MASKTPRFEVYRDKRLEWRWRLKATNGKVIASGEGYLRHGDCYAVVDLLRGDRAWPVVELGGGAK